MKIGYRFVNGEKASIDVSGDFEKIILELDRNLYNNNHAETRRHISLDDFNQNKNVFANIEAGFEERIFNQVDKEILYKALSKLNPDDRQLINKIYLSESKISMTKYATSMGIKSAALWKRLERIRKKLKCIFEELDK